MNDRMITIYTQHQSYMYKELHNPNEINHQTTSVEGSTLPSNPRCEQYEEQLQNNYDQEN